MKRVKLFSLLLCLGLLAASVGCSGRSAMEKTQKQVYAMDTVMLLTCYGDCAEAALNAAEDVLLALDADLDPEASAGSVWAVNHGAGQWVAVSEACAAIAAASLEVSEETRGALEPTLYPVIRAWGFIGETYRVPEQAELDELLDEMGNNSYEVRVESSEIRLTGGELAFGAAAKGYAAEAALQAMADAGAQQAIVSLGGNVQTLGEAKPDGSSWKVAVTDPLDPGDYCGSLTVGQKAVVTSGGYQRYFVGDDGTTYIHILDPATGYPVANGLLSVTVVCDDGVRADALSTALFVLGENGALDYYESYGGCELVLVTDDGRVLVTPGLRGSFEENGDRYQCIILD